MQRTKTTIGRAAFTGLNGVALCGGVAVRQSKMHRAVFSENISVRKRIMRRTVIRIKRKPNVRNVMRARRLAI
jgi:hypothetical protein